MTIAHVCVCVCMFVCVHLCLCRYVYGTIETDYKGMLHTGKLGGKHWMQNCHNNLTISWYEHCLNINILKIDYQ